MNSLTANQIVKALKLMADGDDMASVQINTDGWFILGIGLAPSEHLTQSEFYEVCKSYLGSMNR